MGWVMLAIIGIGALGLLFAVGVPRGLWTLVGAALMLGAAGYAMQGRPGLPGDPVKADTTPIEIDPGVIALRDDMFGHVTAQTPALVAADALTRNGSSDLAINVLLGGIRKYPENAELWTELGDTLALHDGGLVSPPALFAFRRAVQLAPRHPGPYFFLGLAYVRANQFDAARPYWAKALALTPAEADYRPELAVRLQLLDRYLQITGGAPTQ